MASISKRKWLSPEGEAKVAYQVRYKKLDGSTARRQFDKRKDADEFRRKVEPQEPKKAHLRECYTTAKTIGDALDEYLVAILQGAEGKPPVEKTTHDTYFHMVNGNLKPMFSAYRLEDLNPNLCTILRDKLVQKFSNRRYAARMWAFLSRALRHMVARGALVSNPAQGITIYYSSYMPSTDDDEENSRANMPSVAEAQAMIAFAADKMLSGTKRQRAAWKKWYLLLMLGFETGLRIGEIQALPWTCVNFEARTIYVKQTAKRAGFGIGRPKTVKSFRTIGITSELVEMLREWKTRCPTSELDLVFPGRFGNLVSYETIRSVMWKPLMKGAGLTNEEGNLYSPHCMRHFKASVAINAGSEIMKLSRELGHADIKTTYNIYGHLMKESVEKKSENAALVSSILKPINSAQIERKVS